MVGYHWLKETDSTENREAEETNRISEKTSKPIEQSENFKPTSDEISARAYDETIHHMTAEYSDIMPEEQRVRINIESSLYKPTVMSRETYCERFPESDPNVLGHYDSEGQIFLKDDSPEIIRHLTTHEAIHLTSYNELDDSDLHTRIYRSGIRECKYDESSIQYDKNCALNEGITETYALKELRRRGESSSAEAVSAYPEAQKAAGELQDVLGEECIEKAFFGGDVEQLKDEVIRLNFGESTAWDKYAESVDVLEYGTDEEQIRKAKSELAKQNAIMLSFKEYESRTA